MAKIAKIVAQNPWWKHGAEFARFGKNLREARLTRANPPLVIETGAFPTDPNKFNNVRQVIPDINIKACFLKRVAIKSYQ